MSSYSADARAEELQMLRQLLRAPTKITHNASIKTVKSLEAKGEALTWTDGELHLWAEITAKGKKEIVPCDTPDQTMSASKTLQT